jgi:hypothetical protein
MHRTDNTDLATGLVALVLALATALALPALARAEMPNGYAPDVEAELAILESARSGVAAPDGYQPQLRGGQIVLREAPDGAQPQLHRGVETSVVATDGGRSFERDDVAFGFAAGLLIALLAAVAITFASRTRVGVAHS